MIELQCLNYLNTRIYSCDDWNLMIKAQKSGKKDQTIHFKLQITVHLYKLLLIIVLIYGLGGIPSDPYDPLNNKKHEN